MLQPEAVEAAWLLVTDPLAAAQIDRRAPPAISYAPFPFFSILPPHAQCNYTTPSKSIHLIIRSLAPFLLTCLQAAACIYHSLLICRFLCSTFLYILLASS